jgi:hypothetical protein
MNRRQFFGMTAAAVIAAGLPLSVLPERTIFLPPRGGLWLPPRMRQIEQYLINDDSLRMRWDMAWITLGGKMEQAYLLEEPSTSGLEQVSMDASTFAALKGHRREFARECLARKIPPGARVIEVPIPKGIGVYAAHV